MEPGRKEKARKPAGKWGIALMPSLNSVLAAEEDFSDGAEDWGEVLAAEEDFSVLAGKLLIRKKVKNNKRLIYGLLLFLILLSIY